MEPPFVRVEKKNQNTMLMFAMFCAVSCAAKSGWEEELLVGMHADNFRQKVLYSIHFHIVGAVQCNHIIILVVGSLFASCLLLLPFLICCAIHFTTELLFSLLLFHFVPSIYPQTIAYLSSLAQQNLDSFPYLYDLRKKISI